MRALRGQIEDGDLGADQPLPSEADLCARFAVSRTVVRDALRELVQQGLIYKVKGKGAFVAPAKAELRFVGSVTGSAEDLRASGRRVTTEILLQERGAADSREAALLQTPQGQPVVRLRRLRRVDGQALLLMNTTLPAALVPGLEAVVLENQSLYDVLRRRYGLVPAGADRWIEAVMPGKENARLLEVSPVTPVLAIESVSRTQEGIPFEAYHALHRSDRTKFHVGIR